DLRSLSDSELRALADEIRQFPVATVSKTGGHLGPNLGVVELTLALHRVFESPRDRILWDTGHEAYVHKLLTRPREGFARLRKLGGMSDYPNRTESQYDFIELFVRSPPVTKRSKPYAASRRVSRSLSGPVPSSNSLASSILGRPTATTSRTSSGPCAR